MLRELLEENEALRAKLATESSERARLQKLLEKLNLELQLLKRQLHGQKAEKVDPRQTQLAMLPLLEAMGRLQAGDVGALDDAEAALDDHERKKGGETPAKAKKPHGRRDLKLEDLPVHRVVVEPAERKLPGGELLERIGEDVSRHVEWRPGSFVVVEVVYPKYKTPSVVAGEANIVRADPVDMPVPKSMAGAGLLAHVLVSKYADHIPLTRQESILRRHGMRVAKSTLADWVQASTSLLGRIVEAMFDDARENARYTIADATGVLVQAAEVCRRGHFYVLVVPQEHVLFRFTPKNDGDAVARVLEGFKGLLHVDASQVYHELYRQSGGELVEVGCWAHARRGFFEPLTTDRERALVGIGLIGLLYEAQREATDSTGVVDGAKRAAAARPILDRIFAWASEERARVESGTRIHEALGYLANQREALCRFLDDARIRLDTNPAELELRREVVGRKNWLFLGSDSGAQWNTTAVSLIASCAMHGIEPWAYLRDVLTLLPSRPQTRVLELSPKHWRDTRARVGVQEAVRALRVPDHVGRTPPADAGASDG